MQPKQRNSAAITPFLDIVAGGVHDPVRRLRFLQYTAPDPCPGEVDPPKSHWRWFAMIPVFLLAILASTFLMRAGAPVKAAPAPDRLPAPPIATRPAPSDGIWKVEDTGEVETYSNGLRIDNRFAVSNHPRSFLVFPIGGARDAAHGNRPAGIVLHTTESQQVPLQRIERSLIEFVRRKRAYHFLIDHFGRVYRIVRESDAANHAGYSVWADETSVYLNLNESFIGVSFEASTQPGQVEASISSAQIHSAAMLADLLRSRYAIPAANCVTHAQVSVNPDNMRVGYHTDWASSFPYEQLGLPNNYARPLAAIWLFGFECDAAFLRGAGTPQYAGVEAAERKFAEGARREGMTLTAYRKLLQRRYKEDLAATRNAGGPGAGEN